ncbi:MAG: adenylate/guanylate cyclase domain-containing protein [Anaerolineae bacterium]|nr:adenylate/guanylate cyclase domain-containing protein [Anaerolineae bacterium]
MKTETVTIMVVDLVGSTPLVEQVSRQQLLELLEDVTLPIRQAVAEYGGTIVKFTGDGYLATFQSASEALYAGAHIVDAFIGQPILPSGIRLEGCRVVLHTSDVLQQDNDVIGEGVVTVARLEKHVPTNEIYLTATVKEVAKASEFEFQLVGDFPLKGLANPVKVYRLVTEPLSGVERGVYLMITDLLGMSQFMTAAPVQAVNRTIQRWIAIQREAISQVNGRLRIIVGDNLVTTYHQADNAVDALLRLETLVNAHNADPGDLPKFAYTAVICKGDLFVLSIGVNGPLVGHSFRLLERAAHGEKIIEESVYTGLAHYQEKFARREGSDSEGIYTLKR